MKNIFLTFAELFRKHGFHATKIEPMPNAV
jgi:hypothetical protein